MNGRLPHALAALLAVALAGSLALTVFVTVFSRVCLPAADLWQHTTLLAPAAAGEMPWAALWERHNGVHFIPLPKLVYAIDLAYGHGSGVVTATASGLLMLLTCLGAIRLAHRLAGLTPAERRLLALLGCLWLSPALQWESLANPANLQWNGLNAGLAWMANGLLHPVAWLPGAVLAVGSGGPWWVLVLAAVLTLSGAARQRRLWQGVMALLALALAWEILNGYWLQASLPLPFLLYQQVLPLESGSDTSIRALFAANPAGFYGNWLANLASFASAVLLPPLERFWPAGPLCAAAAAWLGWLATRARQHRNTAALSPALAWLMVVILLVTLAAGLLRAYSPAAYTLRFANLGLLFVWASTAWLWASTPAPRVRLALAAMALAYSATLLVASVQEAAGILQASNQRRLSQVAYALDIQDPAAVAETPYAPWQALTFQQINERKGVLARHQAGIFHSPAYRVYAGDLALPGNEVACVHDGLKARRLAGDPQAWKISGSTRTADGQAVHRILFRLAAPPYTPLGYGIYQLPAGSLAVQLQQPWGWAGLLRQPGPAAASVEVIAYNHAVRCPPQRLALP